MVTKTAKPIREKERQKRHHLIQAALDTVQQHGYAETTVQKISEQAGMTKGIIAHYFGDKEGLMIASMRHLIKQIRAQSNDADASVDTEVSREARAYQRLVSIIEANFSETQTTQQAVVLWLNFWAQAMHHPEMARLQRINRLRLQSNITYWLTVFHDREMAQQLAKSMAAMIDGLWLRGAFEPSGIDIHQARQLLTHYLHTIIQDEANHDDN